MQCPPEPAQDSEPVSHRSVTWLDVGCAWLMALVVTAVVLLA